MKVTGYKIRTALRVLETRKDAVVREFTDSLRKYKDEMKRTPDEVMKEIAEYESRIAKLQAAQTTYNQKVVVDVLGNTMTLTEAIKRVGGAGKLVQLWKSAEGYAMSSDGGVRRTDIEVPKPTITPKEVTDNVIKADRWADALRGAIAEGNAISVELDIPADWLVQE